MVWLAESKVEGARGRECGRVCVWGAVVVRVPWLAIG